MVVNKPPGMVVHPARGHWSGTLVGALQYHFGPSLSSSGGPLRPGIVHRLDRDTSGAILVARHDQAHGKLAMQFESRSIEKEYFAIVAGTPERDRDIIDCAIAVASDAPREDDRSSATRTKAAPRRRFTSGRAVRRLRGSAARCRRRAARTRFASTWPTSAAGALRSGVRHRAELTRGELSGDADRHDRLAQSPGAARPAPAVPASANGRKMEIEAPLPADIGDRPGGIPGILRRVGFLATTHRGC